MQWVLKAAEQHNVYWITVKYTLSGNKGADHYHQVWICSSRNAGLPETVWWWQKGHLRLTEGWVLRNVNRVWGVRAAEARLLHFCRLIYSPHVASVSGECQTDGWRGFHYCCWSQRGFNFQGSKSGSVRLLSRRSCSLSSYTACLCSFTLKASKEHVVIPVGEHLMVWRSKILEIMIKIIFKNMIFCVFF